MTRRSFLLLAPLFALFRRKPLSRPPWEKGDPAEKTPRTCQLKQQSDGTENPFAWGTIRDGMSESHNRMVYTGYSLWT